MGHTLKLLRGSKTSPTRTFEIASDTSTANIYLARGGISQGAGQKNVTYSGLTTRADGQRRISSSRDNVVVQVEFNLYGESAPHITNLVRQIEQFQLEVQRYHETTNGDKTWLEFRWQDGLVDLAAPVLGQWSYYYHVLDIEIQQWPSSAISTIIANNVERISMAVTCEPYAEGLQDELFNASGLPDTDSDVTLKRTMTASEFASDWTIAGWMEHVTSGGFYNIFEYYVDTNNYVSVYFTGTTLRIESNVAGSATTTDHTPSVNVGDKIHVAFVQDHTGDSDTTIFFNGVELDNNGTSNAWANNGDLYLGDGGKYGGAQTSNTDALDGWKLWTTDLTAAQVLSLYNAEEPVKSDGNYISRPAWIKTRSGDGVFENVDGVISAAAKDNWGVAGWIPGTVEAKTEWHIDVDTTGDEYVHWLGRLATDTAFTPDATTWLDYSGTSDSGNSSGDAYEPATTSAHTFDASINEPSVLKGRFTMLARFNPDSAISAFPYYKFGASDNVEFDQVDIGSSPNFNLYKLGDIVIDWPQSTAPPTMEAGLRITVDTSLWDDLVSAWNMEDASGATRLDETTTNNDLVDNNTVTQVTGKINNGADFAGTNEYLSLADGSQTNLSPGDYANDLDSFHITCWVNLDTIASTQTIVNKWSSGQQEYTLVYDNPTSRFIFYVSDDGSASTSASADVFGAPAVDTWYFIECYHHTGDDVIGISVNNGARDTTTHSTGINPGSAEFAIGAQSGSSGATTPLNGTVDAVNFFSAVLTRAQVGEIYNSGTGREYTADIGGNLDFIQLLPYPNCRIENEDTTPSYDSGDTLVIDGRNAYVMDSSDSDSQLNWCAFEGERVDLVPHHYNYVFLIQGADLATYTIGNSATVKVYVTPRYGLPGGLG